MGSFNMDFRQYVNWICFAFIISLFISQSAQAEQFRDYYAEPGINPFKETLNQSFNESIDPFGGTLQLSYVDLLIPGNGGLDIQVNRTYTSLQESVGPRTVTGVGWSMHFGRIVVADSNKDKICTQASLWNVSVRDNPSLELPDGRREILVVSLDGNYLITKSRWKARCVTAGSGMIVTSPDGTEYLMDVYDYEGSGISGTTNYYTSKITDLNGNSININYINNGSGYVYVNTVTASDGRLVQYNYIDDAPDGATSQLRLSSITANGQTWKYNYTIIPNVYGAYYQLTEVVRPDNTRWQYEYNPFNGEVGVVGDYSMKRVIYPYGGVIDYAYKPVYFNSDPLSVDPATTAIATKTTSGPDITSGTWNFDYVPGDGNTFDITTVTTPNALIKYYHYGYSTAGQGTMWSVGLMRYKEIYDPTGTTIVQQEINEWIPQKISNENYWHGRNELRIDFETAAPLLQKKSIWRDDHDYITEYNNYDAYGNPGQIVESVNTGTTDANGNFISDPGRITDYIYDIDVAKWIINRVKDETITDIGTISREFDPNNGNLLSLDRYGVKTTYTYTTAGDVETVTDARTNVTRYFDYHRGTAQRVEKPETVVIERMVNDTGTLAWEKDGRLNTTYFSYDNLNRLSAIDYPINADVSVVWTANSKTLTRVNYKEVVTFDGFGRQVDVSRTDTITNETITVTQQYDALAQKIFQSYPNSVTGTIYSYDPLGRIVRMEHPDASFSTTTYGLLPDISANVVIKDERGNITTKLYRSYADPDEQWLIRTNSPENVLTNIERNILGQMTSIWQGELNGSGYERTYNYDARFYLESETNPETGITLYGRDELGNMISKQVGSSPVTIYSYDDLNRLNYINYPNTTPDVSYGYDKNNNIETAGNNIGQRTYTYDANNNLKSETILVAGTTSIINYDYNVLDALDTLTYPSNKQVVYKPNALGRATQVAPYVANITYHPSGEAKQITYANGQVTDYALNDRLWMKNIKTSGISNVVDQTYAYDNIGNVSAIANAEDPDFNRSFDYDGLNRLTVANGIWGTGSISYDAMGNITNKTFGSTSRDFSYVNNQLNRIIGNTVKDIILWHDMYGNVGRNGNNHTYDDASNLVSSSTTLKTIDYQYDANNNRVVRSSSTGQNTHYIYNKAGNLLFEYDPSKPVNKKEYIYFRSQLIAQVVNAPPVANAGNDQAVYGGVNVTLDGSSSSANNNAIVSYSWTQTSGNPVTLSNPSAASTAFVTPLVAADSELTFNLTVVDDTGLSHTDSVKVTVWVVAPPIAVANVQALQGDGQNTLTWSPGPQANSYNIYWGTTPGVTPQTGNAILGVSSPYVHTGLTNGADYYYVITAVNAYGETIMQELKVTTGKNGWSAPYNTTQKLSEIEGVIPGAVAPSSGRAITIRNLGNGPLVQLYEPGVGWSAGQMLTPDADIFSYALSINDAGDAVIFMDKQTYSSSQKVYEVLATVYDASTKTWSALESILTGSSYISTYNRLINESGDVTLVTFRLANSYPRQIGTIMSKYDAASKTWSAQESLTSNVNSTSYVDINEAGDIFAILVEDNSYRPTYYANHFDPISKTWSLKPLFDNLIFGKLQTALNSKGDYIVLMNTEDSSGDKITVGQRYDPGNGWTWTDSATGSLSDAKVEKLHIAKNGDVLAVLSNTGPSYYANWNHVSSGWQEPVSLVDNGNSYGGLSIDIDTDELGNAIVAWAHASVPAVTFGQYQRPFGMIVQANRYTPAGGWEGVYTLDTYESDLLGSYDTDYWFPLVDVDMEITGNASVSWYETTYNERIRRASHYEWLGNAYPNQNLPPIAIVESPYIAVAAQETILSFSGSGYDQDGAIVSYKWSQVSGPAAIIADDTTTTANVTLPFVTAEEEMVLRLTVTDSEGLTGSDEVIIRIVNIDPPTQVIAQPGNGQNVITWVEDPNAASVNLYWSTSPDVTPGTGNLIINIASPYTHTDLQREVTIYYVMTSLSTSGVESKATPIFSGTPNTLLWSPKQEMSGDIDIGNSEPVISIGSNDDMMVMWNQFVPAEGHSILKSNMRKQGAGWDIPKLTNIWPNYNGIIGLGDNYDLSLTNGKAVAIMEKDEGSNDTSVWTSTAQITNTSNWAVARLEEEYLDVDQPKVAFNNQGDGIIVWVSQSVGGYSYSKIIARRFSVTTGWSAKEIIENADNIRATRPSVSINSKGNIIVTWARQNFAIAGEAGVTMSRRYDVNAGSWQAPVQLDDGDIYFTQHHPVVAMDDYGNAIFAWVRSDSLSSYTRSVYAKRYIASTDTWTPLTPLESSSENVSNAGGYSDRGLTISMDGVGNSIVAWRQQDGVGSSVFINEYKVGYGWGGAQRISDPVNGMETIKPRVVMNHVGDSMVIWNQVRDDNGLLEIWGRYKINGTDWAQLQLISDQDNMTAYDPDAVIDTKGNVTVVWVDRHPWKPVDYDPSSSIVSKTLDRSLLPVGPNTLPVANAGSDQQVAGGSVVSLNGSLSSDSDGSITSYSWIQVDGPAVNMTDESTVNPTFTAPFISQDTPITFQLTVTDNDGDTHADLVVVNVLATLLVNYPPVASPDLAITSENTVVSINVISNDSDADGDTLIVTSVTQGANGGVVINTDNTVSYTPNNGFNGSDSFNYTIEDGNGGAATAIVSVTVTAVNNIPVAIDDTVVTAEDTQAAAINVLSNDTDPEGDTLSVTAITQGANGGVVINTDNTVSYTPNNNFNGSDNFTYTIDDGNGGTDTGTVTVNVTPVNDIPAANDDSFNTTVNVSANLNVLGNDTDVDGDSLTVSTVTQGANGSTVINNDNTVTYTPNPNYSGSDAFSYTVNDGNGGSASANVSIQVEPPVTNLLINPGFETGDKTGWTGKGVVATGNANNGTHALKLAGNTTGNLVGNQSVPVVPGNSYRFDAWLKVANRTLGDYRIQLRWYRADGTQITSAKHNFGVTTANSDYALNTTERVAPADAATVKIQLRANKADGNGYFDDIAITDVSGGGATDTQAPNVPGGLTAVAVSTSQIDLSWTASTDNGGGSVAGYNIYRDGASTPINTVTGTSYSDTGLTLNTLYTYTVSAIDDANPANESQPSAPASATTLAVADTQPPTIPTNITATAVSSGQIDLSWAPSADVGGGSVAGYNIFRDGATTPIATVTGTSYADTGLTADTLYSYTVSAIDNAEPANESPPSAAASATTLSAPAVINLLANPGFESGDKTGWTGKGAVQAGNANSGTYALAVVGKPTGSQNTDQSVAVVGGHSYRFEAWLKVVGRTTGSYRFQIRWYNSSGVEISGTRHNFGSTSANTDYVLKSVERVAPADAATVKLRLRAVKADGTGYFDDISIIDLDAVPVIDTQPPGIPGGLSAAAVSTSQIDLSWLASTDTGGGSVAGYNIYRDGASTPINTVTGTSYADTGLTLNTLYTYTVSAIDDAIPANESLPSNAASATTFAVADTLPPTTPTVLTAVAVSNSQIDLSWAPSADVGGGSVAGYRIYRDGDSTPLTTVTDASYADTGLTADTLYSYTVSAYDNATPANESPRSGAASATTLSAPTIVNLLTNPGFESGDKTGWTGKGVVQTGNANTGSYALEIVGKPTGSQNTDQTVPVTGGKTYRFEAWLKVVGRTTGSYRFQIRWYNSSGAEISGTRHNFGSTTKNADYVLKSVERVAPADAATVKLRLRAVKVDGTGYFDDVSITDIN